MNIYCLKDNLSFLRPADLGSLMRLFSRKTIKCTVQMDSFNSYQDKICVKFPRLSQLFSLYDKSQFQMVEIDSFLHTLICLLQNSVLCESTFHSLIQILKNLDSQHKVVRKQSQTICPMALSQEYTSLVLHWQRRKKGSENSWVPGISSSPIQSEYTSASQSLDCRSRLYSLVACCGADQPMMSCMCFSTHLASSAPLQQHNFSTLTHRGTGASQLPLAAYNSGLVKWAALALRPQSLNESHDSIYS